MMIYLILGVQLSCALLILWLLLIHLIQQRNQPEYLIASDMLPKTTVIIPVTGSPACLRENLLSILEQDHPDFVVLFVVNDISDRAVPVLKKLCIQFDNAKIIESGTAVACSQKNHNLLAGVATADQAEILVFCDSGHRAPAGWLNRLVSPLLISQDAVISSGYHQVLVNNSRLVEIGRAICVLGLRLARMVPGFEQPWGGSIAMTQSTFEKLDVHGLWARTVVDDVTLARHLDRNKLSTIIPFKCDLDTTISNANWSFWDSWLTRQWAYLKFVYPLLWLVLGIAGLSFTIAFSAIIILLPLQASGVTSQGLLYPSIIVIIMFLLFALLLRLFHPQPGNILKWVPAFYVALIMAGKCHMNTWFTRTISWAGISYTVGKGGKVIAINKSVEKHS